jgi:ATP-dependent Clp protease ATP-binding subunit ClpC
VNFKPADSLNFAIAKFQATYNSQVFIAARLIIFLLGLTAFFITFRSGPMTLPHINFPVFIWGLYLFWEVFYLIKIRHFELAATIGSTNNLANSFTTNAAKLILKAGSNDLEKIMAVVIKTSFAHFVATRSGLDPSNLPKTEWSSWELYTTELINVAKDHDPAIITDHDLMIALARVQGPLNKALFDAEVKQEDLVSILFWASAEEEKAQIKFDNLVNSKGIAADWAYGYTLNLDRYSHDITKDLTSGRAHPYLAGRDAELKELQHILARTTQSNALLVGEEGTGKTTIVQLLAQKSLQGTTLPQLLNKRFLQLDLTSLLSNTDSAGELEKRLKGLLIDTERAGNIVLVVPYLEYIAGAGEGLIKVDLTGTLMDALTSHNIQVIGLTDHAGYKKYLEPRHSFLEAFERVDVASLDRNGSIRTLEEMAPNLERRHRLILTYNAIKASVDLSSHYLPDKELPGKAIELLDETAVAASSQEKHILTADDVAAFISQKTKVPIGKTDQAERAKLLKLEDYLHQRVIGQNEAIAAVSNALRRSRAGLRDEKRPIGVFLFLGPTGVGKTETSKALANAYFGDEQAMLRIDMSEYESQDSQSKLIGSPNEPGNLTDAVRTHPYCLILLDEIEKAHPKILDTFLQVFDDGRLTDGLGRTIDFTNTIIIATSNAEAEQIREVIQSGSDIVQSKGQLVDNLMRAGTFRPELLNRFDEIVLFRPLSLQEITQVVTILLKDLAANLGKQDINLKVTPEALTKIAQAGFDPIFGARPLRRYIQDHVESTLSKKLLAGEIKRGDTIILKPEDLDQVATS